jgi:glycosyltransferase involved in cell wall biosynthesis
MTVCRNMIVRNEAPVIGRCLASVRPWIDAWAVVDTGSTDGTQDRVREALAGLPGELWERPWRDFGHNRSEAIQLAGTRADYLLFLDADEEWVAPPGFRWPRLEADGYSILHRYSGMEYHRAALAATRLPWRFEGVLHEYLDGPAPHRIETLDGPWIQVHPDGARSTDPRKFEKDAAVLEAALVREPDHPRHTFYLAQSYRDAGRPERSLAVYERRAALGGWAEEVWYSLYQVALLREVLGHPRDQVLGAYLRAYQFRPQRPESLGQLARWCRLAGDHHLAYLFARQALELPPTTDVLFVDPSFTRWRNRDEYALACYWTGRFQEAADQCQRLLDGDALPPEERERMAANLAFAEGALGAGSVRPPAAPARA